ncbi:MAG: C40 family peptidase [Acidobacteriota bacterium]|nr:C40 family peptidase [Acidobacteriota bacterium]
MLNEAHLLNGLPYVWGGGHTDPAWVVGGGYDCSGFVSEVLHSAGYLSAPDTTQTLPGSAGIVKGPGKYVTLYDRTIATIRVWKKIKKMVTIHKAVNAASAGVHVDKGRHPNTLNSVSIRLPKWVGEWQTKAITKLVPSLDNNNNDEHVIIDIAGQWWESGGSSADGGAAMVHQIADPSPAYLKSFNQVLHPQGL